MVAEKKPKKPPVDWEAVERDYCAGMKTLRQIGEENGCTHAGIKKRAARDGWTRDLQAKIQAAAEAKVTKGEVTKEVTKDDLETKVAERQVIEANAEMLAGVIRGHRKDVGRLRGVVSVLLEKVEAILTESDLFKQIGEMCAAPDENGVDKVNELYFKVISLPSQTDSTKKLAETMKILIELERKVFKLETLPDDPAEAVARGAAEGAAKGMGAFTRSALADLMSELEDAATPA
ncbi:MAG: hypothetical protein WC023_01550 [Rhodocyclaceae bacterium]